MPAEERMPEEDYLRQQIKRSLELAEKVGDPEVAQHLRQMAADHQRVLDDKMKRAEHRQDLRDEP
jgi:hypothetical protein